MNYTKNNIYIHVNKLILAGCLVLRQQKEMMDKSNDYTSQRKSDVKQRLIKHKGIFVPITFIDEEIVLSGFESQLLEVFITMVLVMLGNVNSPLTQFSLRTLIEISFYKFQILFSDKLSPEGKNKFKVVSLLADYGFMTDTKYVKDYERLLEKNKGIFNKDDIILFRTLHDAVIKDQERQILVKKVRTLINALQKELLCKTETVHLFTPPRIDAIYSSFSHILHGDYLLLGDIFNPRRNRSHQLRIYTMTTFAVINAVNCVNKLITNTELVKQIDSLNREYQGIADFIQGNWQVIEVE